MTMNNNEESVCVCVSAERVQLRWCRRETSLPSSSLAQIFEVSMASRHRLQPKPPTHIAFAVFFFSSSCCCCHSCASLGKHTSQPQHSGIAAIVAFAFSERESVRPSTSFSVEQGVGQGYTHDGTVIRVAMHNHDTTLLLSQVKQS